MIDSLINCTSEAVCKEKEKEKKAGEAARIIYFLEWAVAMVLVCHQQTSHPQQQTLLIPVLD